ncbi:transmembrane protein, putative (macronuclear) [Tetrahymena thermophila SB210]|uniref:Transmembrane protein, putative n=1 Tax=Tetrahymena thermophila (strain SB210) TaxID=312017 RepID=W7WZT9_TETTS|nr:transmembrane protein, putative [Tetrahymena thermophila SB210]EWS72360.1 transmembrane protein, putative [Tetrahymena thermophila SB210]|eukprot:XP_012655108.1 transmembrane protein, putative [Tetrahymena thermophila SB210]
MTGVELLITIQVQKLSNKQKQVNSPNMINKLILKLLILLTLRYISKILIISIQIQIKMQIKKKFLIIQKIKYFRSNQANKINNIIINLGYQNILTNQISALLLKRILLIILSTNSNLLLLLLKLLIQLKGKKEQDQPNHKGKKIKKD